jgi:hypothetical protein
MTTPDVDSTVTSLGSGDSSAQSDDESGGPIFVYTVTICGADVTTATGGGGAFWSTPRDTPIRIPQTVNAATIATARTAHSARIGAETLDRPIPPSSRVLDIVTA